MNADPENLEISGEADSRAEPFAPGAWKLLGAKAVERFGAKRQKD
jgi:hypothetical protein